MIRHETELILQYPLFCGESREVFCDRMKSLRVSYDIGRLPNSLTEKLEFSSLTADQWKTLIYSMLSHVYGTFYLHNHMKVSVF